MSGCCGACAVGDIHADYGTREITPEDRKRAVIRELINSEPVLHITPGMWRAVGTPARRLSWWRRLLSGRRS